MTMNLYNIFEKLPEDLFNYILSFIEPVSPGTQAIRQEKRERINIKIKGAVSRNSNENMEDHWVFGFTDDIDETLQLQAINCIDCGNYILNDIHIPDRIQCHCYE
jgi:hypothetical protein